MTAQRPDASSELTPGERLTMTRRDIVSFMRHEGRRRPETENPGTGSADGSANAGGDSAYSESQAYNGQEGQDGQGSTEGQGGTWDTLKRTLGAWWHAHPARLALEVAEPVMQKYASAHPLKLLAIAAGVGAAVVLARPWRLVSLTGLAVAALKSSQLSAMAASLLTPKDKP